MVRESHPYRKVFRRGKKCHLQPVCNFFEACHYFIVDWWLVCRLAASPGWKGFSFTPLGHLSFSLEFFISCMTFTLFLCNLFLLSCSSVHLQILPAFILFPGASSPAESAVAFIALPLLHLPFFPLSIWRPYLNTVWWQFIYSPSSLLMHEPFTSHSAASHLSLYHFTPFIVSVPLPLLFVLIVSPNFCQTYFSPSLSSLPLPLYFIASYFWVLTYFVSSQKAISIRRKVCELV